MDALHTLLGTERGRSRLSSLGADVAGAVDQAFFFREIGCTLYDKALKLLKYRLAEINVNPEVLLENEP